MAFVPTVSLCGTSARATGISSQHSSQRPWQPTSSSKVQTQASTDTQTRYAQPAVPAATPPQTTVIWFREDLRLDDHPALLEAARQNHVVAPLVLVPSKVTQFWRDCVIDLRHGLQRLGADLHIRYVESGGAAEGVAEFCREVGASRLHFHRGVSREACEEENAITRFASTEGIKVEKFWTNSLVGPEELPFQITDMPEDCDEFGAALRKLTIEEPISVPEGLVGIGGCVVAGEIPIVKEENERQVRGGEREGVMKMKDYVMGKSLVSVNGGGSIGVIDTKFGRLGPFLTMGCLSPRRLWHEVVREVSNRSVRRYCAEFELLLRDFFRFMTLKHGVHPV